MKPNSQEKCSNINKNTLEINTEQSQTEERAPSRPNELNLNVNLQQHKAVNCHQSPGSFLHDNLENPPNQETVDETNALYLLMLSEQMRHLGLQLNQINPNLRRQRPGFRNSRSLRILAEKFAQSPQRRWVYEQAQNVDLDSLNFRTFQQLLNGLFEEGGVTWERILVLFYFCTDISIRAFQEKFVTHFLDIYNWTTIFLSGRLAAWVDTQGGWSVVLQNSVSLLSKATVFTLCCAAVAASYMYIRRK